VGATSTQFNISLTGEACKGNCPQFSTLLKHNVLVQSSATGAFTFLALSPFTIPTSVTTAPDGGCANYVSVGQDAFQETDGRSGTTGTLNFIFGIPQAAIKNDPNIGNGQKFIPICAGSAHVDAQGNVIKCTAQGVPYGPWTGEALDPTTHNFTGVPRDAVCDPATGLYWGILGSFQDSAIDPATNPIVTNWKSDTTYRYFYMNVPYPWDWSMG
jgi:hypothetical protein